MKPSATLTLLTLLATGCAVGPDFQPPSVAVPQGWHAQSAQPDTDQAAVGDLTRWWQGFNDPILDSLIARAWEKNLDLRQAEARIRQARAVSAGAVAGLWPSLDATAGYRRSRSSSDGTTVHSDLYQAGFDASWEVDIFGSTRRGMEAAEADLRAAIDGRRDLMVSLTAELAGNYVSLRSLQQRLDIARRNLAVQEQSVELTRRRQQGGFTSGLDVAAAEGQAAVTAAQLPLLASAIDQAIHGVGLLLGEQPAALFAELAPPALPPPVPPVFPVTLPADLVGRRSDIRRAEALAHAATARVGVAEAARYPRVVLPGSIGFQNSSSGELFSWPNRIWSVGPSISWALFDAGALRAGVEKQRAVLDEAVLAYEQTVLTALHEVENNLVAAAREEERGRELVRAVAANKKTLALATRLYREGQVDYLSVLDAQRALYSSEDTLAQSHRSQAGSVIALFKALGGGWQQEK
ncbi:MAG: hypothetical protein BWK76_02455 [Desulfobulbaceae bacterium A2]|nr:MAG: hypothetical protein BWK76_02455 [Desulfobulbaceae bacterium A2]